MRRIISATSAEEAVKLRHEIENSSYLAGGTEVMRLGSSIDEECTLIDISSLPLSGITKENGKIRIGALTPLEDIRNSELVPAFIREAASFAASLQLRNAATIGGNFALRRSDSYMAAALLASGCTLRVMCTKGEKEKSVSEYFEKKGCRALILSFDIDESRKGSVHRIGRSSHSHAAVIMAESMGIWAYSVSGAGIAYGSDRNVYESIDYHSDLTGSAEYKKYLASVLAEEGSDDC